MCSASENNGVSNYRENGPADPPSNPKPDFPVSLTSAWEHRLSFCFCWNRVLSDGAPDAHVRFTDFR